MIAPRFGFTRDFPRKRNTGPYCRPRKIPCGFKDQARARLLTDFSGLNQFYTSSSKPWWEPPAGAPLLDW